MQLPDTLRQKLQALPDRPGCYLFRDRRGRIIYVGKAVSLRKRVQSYFREASLRRGSPKLRGLVNSVVDLDTIVVRNEAEAVLTEGRLIKEYRPRYNVSFRDDKRFLLLRLDPREPLPVMRLCRIQRDDEARYFGPYASSQAARAALDFVEKKYGLRKCTPRVPDEQTYRHCLNDIIRFCSAPCIGNVDAAGYHVRVEEACAFLRGRRPAVLEEVRAAMEAAAAKLDFERAGALRDTLFRLRAIVRQRANPERTPALRAQDALAGIADLQRNLGLAVPPRVIEAFDISNTFGTYAVASMVCAIDGLPRANRYRRFRIRTVTGIDDPRMIREVVSRRYARLVQEGQSLPDLVLVDGGITQLRAAYDALVELGLAALPLAGLAKRVEEIYTMNGPPLLLPRNAPALHVLQRLRDEAHRFALTYHRGMRNRRIRESALDEIPGIGPKRKQALLHRFGSLQRLMKADLADVAGVPGVGETTARLIRAHLRPETNGE